MGVDKAGWEILAKWKRVQKKKSAKLFWNWPMNSAAKQGPAKQGPHSRVHNRRGELRVYLVDLDLIDPSSPHTHTRTHHPSILAHEPAASNRTDPCTNPGSSIWIVMLLWAAKNNWAPSDENDHTINMIMAASRFVFFAVFFLVLLLNISFVFCICIVARWNKNKLPT